MQAGGHQFESDRLHHEKERMKREREAPRCAGLLLCGAVDDHFTTTNVRFCQRVVISSKFCTSRSLVMSVRFSVSAEGRCGVRQDAVKNDARSPAPSARPASTKSSSRAVNTAARATCTSALRRAWRLTTPASLRPFAQAFRAGRPHKVPVQNLEHGRARDARRGGGQNEAQRQGGQEHVPEVLQGRLRQGHPARGRQPAELQRKRAGSPGKNPERRGPKGRTRTRHKPQSRPG